MTAYRRIRVEPLTGVIGAEVSGVRLTAPDDESLDEIRRALAEHAVLCFHDQPMTPEEQVAFTAQFGELRPSPHYEHKPGYPDILIVKREADRDALSFGGVWHADESFVEVPCCLSTLHAVDVPPYGGDTMFASCAAAYDALSPGMKALCDNQILIYNAAPSHIAAPDADKGMARDDMKSSFVGDPFKEVGHPLVNVNRVTGRRQLWVTGKTAVRFADMTADESRPLIDYLYHHITQPAFTCRVRYRKDTLVMWDNFALLHIALGDHRGFRRELNRVQVCNVAPQGVASATALAAHA